MVVMDAGDGCWLKDAGDGCWGRILVTDADGVRMEKPEEKT